MISRKTAKAIGEIYQTRYTATTSSSSGSYKTIGGVTLYKDLLYDFLYENDYDAWFCNAIKNLRPTRRSIKEFVMRLHTGESLFEATNSWSWDARQKLGQRYLKNLAEDFIQSYESEDAFYKQKIDNSYETMRSSLELDGYIFRGGKLLFSESDILDLGEEQGVLESLYFELKLNNKQTAIHHLNLSEEHYLEKRWDDSISNSRKFLEAVLQEIAYAHSIKVNGSKLDQSIYDRPIRVRDYLENCGLLEKKEKEALSSIYGLLSNTGSHPYIAENDQARLLRHLALTYSQFVMLRFQGLMKKYPSA